MNKGMAVTALAYCLWGLLPVFWKGLDQLSPLYILNARIVWSFLFCILLVMLYQHQEKIKHILKDKRNLCYALLAGLVITSNWGIYIWAVNSGHILDSSMGYYMNPLFVILFGAVFFKEKLTKAEWLAIVLAAIGVVIMVLQYGQFPWIAIMLALTFTIYGAIKKMTHMDTLTALTIETAAVVPVALIALCLYEFNHSGVIATENGWLGLLVVFTGAATAVPLLLYGYGITQLPFSTVGFFQYISPTFTLLLGLFVYHESINKGQMIAFIFVWLGLIIFIGSKIFEMKNSKRSDLKNTV